MAASVALPPVAAVDELVSVAGGGVAPGLSAATELRIFNLARALKAPVGSSKAYATEIAAVKLKAEREAVFFFCLPTQNLDQAIALTRRADIPKAPLYGLVIGEARTRNGPGNTAVKSPAQIAALERQERRAAAADTADGIAPPTWGQLTGLPEPNAPPREPLAVTTARETKSADPATRFAGLVWQAWLNSAPDPGEPAPPAATADISQALALLRQHPEIWDTELSDVGQLMGDLAYANRRAEAKMLVAPLLAHAAARLARIQSEYSAQPSEEARDLFACRLTDKGSLVVAAFRAVYVASSVDLAQTTAMVERTTSVFKPLLLGALIAYGGD
ncbi:MAG: hypothetical protein ACRD13_06030 [Terriglobales bacterium]